MSADVAPEWPKPIVHKVTEGRAEAVNQAQLEHLATLGWELAPPPAVDAPEELFADRADSLAPLAGLEALADLSAAELAELAALAQDADPAVPPRQARRRFAHPPHQPGAVTHG